MWYSERVRMNFWEWLHCHLCNRNAVRPPMGYGCGGRAENCPYGGFNRV